LQLTVGQPLTWSEYLKIEEVLRHSLDNKAKSLEERFLEGSNYLIERVSQGRTPKVAPAAPASPKEIGKLNHLDRNLITALHQAYFPSQIVGKGQGDFNWLSFSGQVMASFIYPMDTIQLPSGRFKLATLLPIEWPQDDRDIEDLLYRYFLSRLFAKLYFGAGFGQLSLVAGFHHLALLLALLKLQARALAQAREAPSVSFVDVIASVRQLEKRLGEVTVGPYAATTLELLLFSPQRLRRLLNACR
jgi:hypothetical protein